MEVKEEKDLLSRLIWVDRRILYWLLVVVVLLPQFMPLGLPLSVSDMTKTAFETIDSVPPGSIAMVGQIGAAQWPELGGGGLAIAGQLLGNDVKIIFWGTVDTAGPQIELMFKALRKELAGKEYGVDYINLGMVPGKEAAYVGLANDFYGAIKKDYYGNDLKEMALTKDIRGAVDIALVTDTTGGTTPLYYTRHWYEVYGTPYVSNCIALMYPLYVPYVEAGQIAGMLNGLRGGAEYELLLRKPGISIASMDSMSTTHLLVIAFILIGNIAEIVIRAKKGGKR